jgi:hypothetical protein
VSELRRGVPYVEDEPFLDEPVRFGVWLDEHVSDRAVTVLDCVGPNEARYGALWYEFTSEEEVE